MKRRAEACNTVGEKNSTGFSGCTVRRYSDGLVQIVFESPISVFLL